MPAAGILSGAFHAVFAAGTGTRPPAAGIESQAGICCRTGGGHPLPLMKDRGNVYGHRPDFQDRGHRHHRGGAQPAAHPLRPGRPGHDDHTGGAGGGAVHPGQADQRAFCHHQVPFCAMSALTMLGLAVMGAVLYTLFQKSAPAFGLFISMGTVVLVLWKISAAAQTVLSGLTKLEQRAGGDAFSCLLRCTGIILLADYAHSLCEEAGAESLAWCTALAGRVLVLAAAWPLLEEIGQKIGSIAG